MANIENDKRANQRLNSTGHHYEKNETSMTDQRQHRKTYTTTFFLLHGDNRHTQRLAIIIDRCWNSAKRYELR